MITGGSSLGRSLTKKLVAVNAIAVFEAATCEKTILIQNHNRSGFADCIVPDQKLPCSKRSHGWYNEAFGKKHGRKQW